MIIDTAVVTSAFSQHAAVHASRKAWNVEHHVSMWELGDQAISGRSLDAFEKLYETLRVVWKAFRGNANSTWTASATFERLMSLDDSRRATRLSDITFADAGWLWNAIEQISGIKTNKDGPAVVAISKFLHFWNPRVFVIVDYGVIWNWVFKHGWLRKPLLKTRQELIDRAPKYDCYQLGKVGCDVVSYLAILLWGAQLLRTNPNVLSGFQQYVAPFASSSSLAGQIANYDAAALEWFLSGVVEIPPHGIHDQNVG